MRKLVAVVICREGKYLVLKRRSWKGWEFVKGNVEKESLEAAALRESMEETGLRIKIIGRLTEIKYSHEEIRGHTTSVQAGFLATCTSSKVKISHEHSAYRWVTAKVAASLLTHETHRDFLKAALDYAKF